MAYIPGSSFIPKDTSVTPKVMQRKRTFHVVGFVASVMLIVSLLMAGGVFVYQISLKENLKAVQAELAKAKDENLADNLTAKIAEIAVFDQQLKTATRLLDNHIAPSRIFAELEKMTKKTVHYKTFEYTYDPGYVAELTVVAGTDEITSVASQKIEFTDQKLFTEFSIENISLTLKDGKDATGAATRLDSPVTFALSGKLDAERIRYTGEQEGSVAHIPQTSQVASTSNAGTETAAVADSIPENVTTP